MNCPKNPLTKCGLSETGLDVSGALKRAAVLNCGLSLSASAVRDLVRERQLAEDRVAARESALDDQRKHLASVQRRVRVALAVALAASLVALVVFSYVVFRGLA